MHRTKEVVEHPVIEMDNMESEKLWSIITRWRRARTGNEGKGLVAPEIDNHINHLMTKAYILGQKEGPSDIKQGF